MRLLPSDTSIGFLSQVFPVMRFSLYRSDDSAKFISCFVAIAPNAATVQTTWERLANQIAANYQMDLEDTVAQWNIYLTFAVPEKIEPCLKSRIENDRFSMRKIVFDGIQVLESDEDIVRSLENMIFGADLDINTFPAIDSESIGESLLERTLGSIPLIPNDYKDNSVAIRRRLIDTLLQGGKNED